MTPPKVVLLIDSLVSGGAQRQMVGLAVGLREWGYSPLVVYYHPLRHFREELDCAGVEVRELLKTDKAGFSFLTRFRLLLAEERPALLHSYLSTPNIYARLMRMEGRVPRVITSERNTMIERMPLRLLAERATWRLSDRIIVNANSIRDVLVRRAGVSHNRITVVPNGVSPEVFSVVEKVSGESGLSRGASGQPWVLAICGRVTVQKGHHVLVEAVSLLLARHPGLPLDVRVWGEELDAAYSLLLRKKIALRRLEGVFRFLGVKRDMNAIYREADLIVQPSLWEGFPNVVLEAMAAGKVVVTTAVSDNSMIVVDGETGFLVPPGDPGALADAMERAILHVGASERAGMGKKAAAHARSDFSMKRMVSRTVEIYRQILANGTAMPSVEIKE